MATSPSTKERHRSIEETIYKIFDIPEALQDKSGNDNKFVEERIKQRASDAGAALSNSSRTSKSFRDSAGRKNDAGRLGRTKASLVGSPNTEARTRSERSLNQAKLSEEGDNGSINPVDEDGESWENVTDDDRNKDSEGKNGKQRFAARKPRNIFRQQNLTSSKNMTKEMFHKLHRVNLLSLKERDYSDLDLDEWCAIQETLLREASHGESSSADLVSQQAHLGPAVHDSSSDANFHNMWTSKTPITHSCLSDLIPVDEDFGLGDTMAEMLEKADHETLRDIMHVYYPAFKKNESLRVDYDAYYESEPDTLSCCSDPPTAEEEDRMERRAWTIQMPEIFEMLRANVGHLSDYALLDRSSQHFLAVSAGLSEHRSEVLRLQRYLCQLMEVGSADMSKIVQSSRELYVPFANKMYVLHALDSKVVMGRTTEVGTYSGFIGRPVLGLFLLCFYGPNAHMVVILDIVNSLVDYISFSVLDCLPEYEDGFEDKIKEVLDEDEVKDDKKGKRRSRHDLSTFISRDMF